MASHFALLIGAMAGSHAMAADAICQLDRLTAEIAHGGDSFGWSMTSTSDVAVVGAYYGQGTVFGAGNAQVFQRQGIQWVHRATLWATDGAFGDYFGNAVALWGDGLLIGASGQPHNDSTGAVYCYRLVQNVWLADGKLLPPTGFSCYQFGYAIAVHEDDAIITAFQDHHGILSGLAFAFRRVADQWQFISALTAANEPKALLGWAVAMDKNRAIIGALSSTLEPPTNGAAYVFERSPAGTWNQTAKLIPSSGNADIGFGVAVAVQNDISFVGSYKDNDPAHQSGSVYVFRRESDGTWLEQSRLTAGNGYSHDYFGYSIALDENRLLVGAIGRGCDGGSDCGAAYVFQCSPSGAWSEVAAFEPPNLANQDYFGWAVGFAGPYGLIAARGWDQPADNTGAVLVFPIDGCDCNFNDTLDACDIASKSSADLNQDSVPDECQSLGCLSDCVWPPDGEVNVSDLLGVLNHWGQRYPLCGLTAAGANSTVDLDDLLAVINAWGLCP